MLDAFSYLLGFFSGILTLIIFSLWSIYRG